VEAVEWRRCSGDGAVEAVQWRRCSSARGARDEGRWWRRGGWLNTRSRCDLHFSRTDFGHSGNLGHLKGRGCVLGKQSGVEGSELGEDYLERILRREESGPEMERPLLLTEA